MFRIYEMLLINHCFGMLEIFSEQSLLGLWIMHNRNVREPLRFLNVGVLEHFRNVNAGVT